MRAIVTVGLGFGDEGKGATVDYLARCLDADLVVRYCGGAQAGHNVELPSGLRHTFSQFGAGTLAGVPTWLGSRVIVSPATMLPEAAHLAELGVNDPFSLLSVHPECLVATSYHVWMNRLREAARGAGRHGSCGLGIGETRHYWLRYGSDAVCAKDLADRDTLIAKLTLLRDRLLVEMQDLAYLDNTTAALVYETSPAAEADELSCTAEKLKLARQLPAARTVLFEGAQGALLDEWHGFHPYTTWSTVTPRHALEIIEEHAFTDVQVLGLTRAYTTRHGAGPFPTESKAHTASLIDRGNPANRWQGAIRSGPLDLVLLDYAARACRVDGLVVSCLDQLPASSSVCESYGNTTSLPLPRGQREQTRLAKLLETAEPVLCETTHDELLERLGQIAAVMITADGPTHKDRQTTAAGAMFQRSIAHTEVLLAES